MVTLQFITIISQTPIFEKKTRESPIENLGENDSNTHSVCIHISVLYSHVFLDLLRPSLTSPHLTQVKHVREGAARRSFDHGVRLKVRGCGGQCQMEIPYLRFGEFSGLARLQKTDCTGGCFTYAGAKKRKKSVPRLDPAENLCVWGNCKVEDPIMRMGSFTMPE